MWSTQNKRAPLTSCSRKKNIENTHRSKHYILVEKRRYLGCSLFEKRWRTSSLEQYYCVMAVGQIRELDGVTFFQRWKPPSVHLECSLNNCNILTSRHKWKKQCETKNQSSKKLYCQHCFRPHSSKIFKFFHTAPTHVHMRLKTSFLV